MGAVTAGPPELQAQVVEWVLAGVRAEWTSPAWQAHLASPQVGGELSYLWGCRHLRELSCYALWKGGRQGAAGGGAARVCARPEHWGRGPTGIRSPLRPHPTHGVMMLHHMVPHTLHHMVPQAFMALYTQVAPDSVGGWQVHVYLFAGGCVLADVL